MVKILGTEVSKGNLLAAGAGIGLGALFASVIYKQDTIRDAFKKVSGHHADIFQAEQTAREYLRSRQIDATNLVSCNYDGHDWVVALQSEDKNFVYTVKVDAKQGRVSGWTVTPKT